MLLPTRKDAPRDLVLYSMALGIGLRLSDLLGLNVGDISQGGRDVRRRVTLHPATTKHPCLAQRFARRASPSTTTDVSRTPRTKSWRRR